MLQIRQKAFETNSSSTHAVVLESGSLQRKKKIDVPSWGFGYNRDGIKESNLPEDKISLLIYQDYLSDRQVAKLLKDFCGCKLYMDGELVDEYEDFSTYSYTPQYFNTPQKVIDFIFNDGYTAYTFSDEEEYNEIEYDNDYNIIKIEGQRVLERGN